jgi:putative aldouronate transport system permease protein
MSRKKTAEKVFDTANILFFVVFSLTIAYPFFQQFIKSISPEAEVMSRSFSFWPHRVYWGNWLSILGSRMMWLSFYNTIFVVILGSLYSLLLSATFAYPLSRRDLPLRNMWTLIIVFTMYFSGGLIPTYLLIRSLGMLNSRLVLIIGGLNVWNTLIMRNFFMTIPESLQESARIDGASEAAVLFRIVIPLSMPVVATVLLWNLVANWTSWVACMIYITDPKKQVLQIILRNMMFNPLNIMSMNDARAVQSAKSSGQEIAISNEGLKSAVLMFITVPILFSYPFLQKYFIKGVMMGSIKG